MYGIQCKICGHKKKLSENFVIDLRTKFGTYDEGTLTILNRIAHHFKCEKCKAKAAEIIRMV